MNVAVPLLVLYAFIVQTGTALQCTFSVLLFVICLIHSSCGYEGMNLTEQIPSAADSQSVKTKVLLHFMQSEGLLPRSQEFTIGLCLEPD
jgi:hypothetical protein